STFIPTAVVCGTFYHLPIASRRLYGTDRILDSDHCVCHCDPSCAAISSRADANGHKTFHEVDFHERRSRDQISLVFKQRNEVRNGVVESYAETPFVRAIESGNVKIVKSVRFFV